MLLTPDYSTEWSGNVPNQNIPAYALNPPGDSKKVQMFGWLWNDLFDRYSKLKF